MSYESPLFKNGSNFTRRENVIITVQATVYLIAMLSLFHVFNYPDSLGVHMRLGKMEIFGYYWYSYLLIERHSLPDLVLFLCIWVPILVMLGLTTRGAQRDRKAREESGIM